MHRLQLATLLFPLLVAPAYGADSFSCENIKVDGHSFDLSKLKGPHSVLTSRFESTPPLHFNTTYTLDICGPLAKSGGKDAEECPDGTRVCAIERLLKGDTSTVLSTKAIAGDLQDAGGTKLDWSATPLKTSDSKSDSQKEGLRLVLNGGKHPLGGPVKERRDQKAIIDFVCDAKKEGTEGEWSPKDKKGKLRVRGGEKDSNKEDKGGDKDEGESSIEHQIKNEGAALIWDGFKEEKDADVLRLTWYTKYACEKREDGDDEESDTSSHWGFFTWFILIAFLGIAGYLIFSSWINFTRYGARGWDLLPHSDTIRDIPYLLKDWLRRVLNTVQGTGSRGGYSAV